MGENTYGFLKTNTYWGFIPVSLLKSSKEMNTKLTLTIEQSIIDEAKKYARKRERSLSDLIENYLKALIKETPSGTDELTPTVKALRGSFKRSEDMDYKDELAERLSEKYL
jgi:hypothetical protein